MPENRHWGGVEKSDSSPNSQEFWDRTVRFTQNSLVNQLMLQKIQEANGKTPKENGGVPWRFAAPIGVLSRDNTVDMNLLQDKKETKENFPSKPQKAMYSCERYQFFLDSPFEISSTCCNCMKKRPIKKYEKETGRKQITAQMASESRLRTQQWLSNGCNGFDLKHPISNPMSFWTEQDVLLYIREHYSEMLDWRSREYMLKTGEMKVFTSPIASVYGDIVSEDEEAGQMTIGDYMDADVYELFDLERPSLHTTGCNRTGCFACGFGQHHENTKEKSRLQQIIDFSNPKLADWMLRGGHFRESDGMWEPYQGLGLAFVYEWINQHGGFNIWFPDKEKYLSKLPEECWRYLHK